MQEGKVELVAEEEVRSDNAAARAYGAHRRHQGLLRCAGEGCQIATSAKTQAGGDSDGM